MQAALAEKVNRRLEMDSTMARNVAPNTIAPSQHPTLPSLPAAQPHVLPTMDFNNQPSRPHDHDSDDDSDDDDAWLNDDIATDPVLQAIRQRRLQELQQQHNQQLALRARGHGDVRTIAEDEFLPECTGSSEYVVVHFYHEEFETCRVLDHHLSKIAPLHLEAKFLRLNATKAPFFVTKLKVQVLPTLIVFQHGKMKDRMTGFDKVVDDASGIATTNINDWETSRLQVWLATTGAIQYTASKEREDHGNRVGYRSRIYRGSTMDDDTDNDM